VEGIYLKLFYT